MKTHELEKRLKEGGCRFVKHGRRHDIWYSPITDKHFPVPRHGAKEVPNGTLSVIANESGVIF
jgi:predicted RNA binding protein YcfA (HicA-like mRNA interferase family)